MFSVCAPVSLQSALDERPVGLAVGSMQQAVKLYASASLLAMKQARDENLMQLPCLHRSEMKRRAG
jgi:hypothetical protein